MNPLLETPEILDTPDTETEETPSQIFSCLRSKEGATERLVFWPDGADINGPSVLQCQVSVPLLRIGCHSEFSMGKHCLLIR